MANEIHLKILTWDLDIWNQLREYNLEIIPDLSHANLYNTDLSHANLNKTDLHLANLNRADLSHAYLSEANLHCAFLSNANLRGASFYKADLSHADLRYADLQNADLRHANLNNANLQHVNLYKAKLSETNLSRVDLRDTDLRHVDFRNADLRYANFHSAYLDYDNLSHANLSNANLYHASFRDTDLSEADLTNVSLGYTTFSNVDLSEVKGLETVHHAGPSTIGIDTITRSQGKIPEIFLRGVGVPDVFITYMQSLINDPIQYYSCFICHSSKDKPFVERLYADLQANGVRCWYAPRDLTIGEPFLLGIEKGIRLHEKLLLVFSKHSVNSKWVQHEVLSAMAKEKGKEPWVLFPIRLDDSVMQPNILWADMIKQTRHIGDFTQWKDHDAYQEAFNLLLRDLKVER